MVGKESKISKMSEKELVTTIPSRYEACKTCITAIERIRALAAQTKIVTHPVKVVEIHLECRIEPRSEVIMSGSIKKMVTINGLEKSLNGTLDRRSVYCPGKHGSSPASAFAISEE